MQSIQNLGLALISMAAGAILDTHGYLVLEVFFCACICSQYLLCVYEGDLSSIFTLTLLTQCELLCVFPPLFPAVALMAVVTLYFVDYLRGKNELDLFSCFCFLSSFIGLCLCTKFYFNFFK